MNIEEAKGACRDGKIVLAKTPDGRSYKVKLGYIFNTSYFVYSELDNDNYKINFHFSKHHTYSIYKEPKAATTTDESPIFNEEDAVRSAMNCGIPDISGGIVLDEPNKLVYFKDKNGHTSVIMTIDELAKFTKEVEIKELLARLDKCKEALEFYANGNSHESSKYEYLDEDREEYINSGERAAKVLKEVFGDG